MKHENIEGLIQKALDRELSADEETRLTQHLVECQECRVYYEQMVALHDECRMLFEVFPLQGFNGRVMRALGVRPARVWKKVSMVLAGSWAAVVAVLLLSPLPGIALHKLITSIPAFTRLVNVCATVVTSLSHFVTPILAVAGNVVQPGIGLVLSIFIFYFFAKMLKKEVTCRA